jgi:hypothetical protein
MVQNVTDEQRVSELVDNCQRAVHQSLADIQKAIALLESSINTGETREKLPETIETVQDILEEVIVEFQNLDRQIQATVESEPSLPHLVEKSKLKTLFDHWLKANNFNKTA